ncbi:MAG: hypothetical protein M1837_001904 [Sclerophora amabilis]|nr:MAG: hypothetical protein M1837_001904 [Sclerophora amabilis]
MSGRSAHVRRQKAKCKILPLPRGSTDKYDAHGFPMCNDPFAAESRPSSTRGGAPSMAYSSSSQETRRFAYGPSESCGIPRSAFRIFMDDKTDAFRSMLSTKLGSKDAPEKPHQGNEKGPVAASRSLAGVQKPVISSNTGPPVRTMPDPSSLEISQADNLSSPPRQPVIKQWIGGGKTPQPWNKWNTDPELFDPTGDTEIYFASPSRDAGGPAFRIHSSMLEKARPGSFLSLLHEAQQYYGTGEYATSISSPRTGSIDTSSSAFHSASDGIPPLFHPDQHHPRPPPMMMSPPASLLSDAGSVDRDPLVVYRVFFPARPNGFETGSMRYRVATRNLIAFLLGKSLVGVTLYQTLMDLFDRLRFYCPSEPEIAQLLIGYITSHHLHDVRNDPISAVAILAWSQENCVQWFEGWREAFVHCVGMYERLKAVREMSDMNPSTKKMLQFNQLQLQVRVDHAQEKLAKFDLNEMWSIDCVQSEPIKASFESFRTFLVKFYERYYWTWPPSTRYNNGETWLTRDLVHRLQEDFGALYDYLVDRDMVWDESEKRSERKWKIVSKGSKMADFNADGDDVGITDIFVGFDNSHKYPHIPHPFPLLPSSMPTVTPPAKPSRFVNKKPKSPDGKGFERRAALAYSEASNLFLLGSNFVSNDLVEAFSRFESEKIPGYGDIDPYVARKGRWILLYGILQVLATMSVDPPGLRYTEGIDYFVNPCLGGKSPWKDAPKFREGNHQDSYCWVTAEKWDTDHFNGPTEPRTNRHGMILPENFARSWERASPTPTPESLSKPWATESSTTSENSSRPWAPNLTSPMLENYSKPREPKGTTNIVDSARTLGDQRAWQWVNSGGGLHKETTNTIASSIAAKTPADGSCEQSTCQKDIVQPGWLQNPNAPPWTENKNICW